MIWVGIIRVYVLRAVPVVDVVPVVWTLVDVLSVHQQVIDVTEDFVFRLLDVCGWLHIPDFVGSVCAVKRGGGWGGCVRLVVWYELCECLALGHVWLFAFAPVLVFNKLVAITFARYSWTWLFVHLFVQKCLLWLIVWFESRGCLFR